MSARGFVVLAIGVLSLFPSSGFASVAYSPPYDDAQTFERCSELVPIGLYSCSAEAHADKLTGALSGAVVIQPTVDNRIPGTSSGYGHAQIQVAHPVAKGSRAETISATIHINRASVDGPSDGSAASVSILFGAQFQDLELCNCYAYITDPIVQTAARRTIANEDFTVMVTVHSGSEPFPAGTLIITAGLNAEYRQGMPLSIREHSATADFDAVVTEVRGLDT